MMEVTKVILTEAQSSLVQAMLQSFSLETTSDKAKACALLMEELGVNASLECFVGSILKRLGSDKYLDVVLEALFDQLAGRTAITLTDEEASSAELDLAQHASRYAN